VGASTAVEPVAAIFSVTPEPTSRIPAPVAEGSEDHSPLIPRRGISLHPMSDTQAEVLNANTEKAISSAEIAVGAMNCYDTWEKAVGKMQWVMDSVSPIAQVRSSLDLL